MKYTLVGRRAHPTLVVRPREGTYGHQVLEVLMALHMAVARGGRVVYVKPRHVANHALFELQCREVPIVRGTRSVLLRLRAKGVAAVGHVRFGWRVRFRGAYVNLLTRGVERFPGLRPVRKRAKARLGTLQARAGHGPPDFFGLDFRECYARRALHIALLPHAEAGAAQAAAAIGIEPDARIVVLHVRESGFKQAAGGDRDADAIRNARIETYFDAIDLLVSRGFTVVRVGDRYMTPVQRIGVVDLATSPARTDELELWLMFRSRMFIACDSGPYAATYMTATPCLAVNVTNVIGGYPVRKRDRYILKRVHDARLGRELTLREMLTLEYFEQRKDLLRYRFIDNTPEEIRAAVEEMLGVFDGDTRLSDEQQAFFQLADRLYGSEDVAARRVRKGEPARQLLGDGAIARFFAARHLGVELVC